MQNWPLPCVTLAANVFAHLAVCNASSSGSRTTGFRLPISAYTGIGSLRLLTSEINAIPPEYEPVNPTALIKGCLTNSIPAVNPSSKIIEKKPWGKWHFSPANKIASATNLLVSGCPLCALTITGQPAAKADMVSPPATEKANGKLLAPKTTTEPTATFIFLISVRTAFAASFL